MAERATPTKRRILATTVTTILALGSAPAAIAAPSEAARNAAMSELAAPDGVGGCVFRSVSADARRTVVAAMLSGPGGPPPELKAGAEAFASRCAKRAYSGDDTAYVAAVISAFRKAAVALAFAQKYGLGQKRLDAAWAEARPAEKAAFYAVADDFIDPKRSIADRALDTAPFARRLELQGADEAATLVLLRMYYTSMALSERAEARLGQPG